MVFNQYNLLFKRMQSSSWNFCDSDSEEFFNKNLISKPKDWYYRDNPISYTFNSLGFRCSELSEINFDNYILFLGDSHTEGVGLHLENTYPYQVSKQLNKSYFNLGSGGTGIDVMFYNLITWLNTFPHPQYIVLFYTENTRTLVKMPDDFRYQNISINWSEGDTNHDNAKKFLVLGDLLGFFNSRTNLYAKMIDSILKNHKIHYKNITTYDQKLDSPQHIEVINAFTKPRARDYHVGIEWHNEVTELLVKDYHDKYSNATVYSTIRGQI